jgi:hypothetical protein
MLIKKRRIKMSGVFGQYGDGNTFATHGVTYSELGRINPETEKVIVGKRGEVKVQARESNWFFRLFAWFVQGSGSTNLQKVIDKIDLSFKHMEFPNKEHTLHFLGKVKRLPEYKGIDPAKLESCKKKAGALYNKESKELDNRLFILLKNPDTITDIKDIEFVQSMVRQYAKKRNWTQLARILKPIQGRVNILKPLHKPIMFAVLSADTAESAQAKEVKGLIVPSSLKAEELWNIEGEFEREGGF